MLPGQYFYSYYAYFCMNNVLIMTAIILKSYHFYCISGPNAFEYLLWLAFKNQWVAYLLKCPQWDFAIHFHKHLLYQIAKIVPYVKFMDYFIQIDESVSVLLTWLAAFLPASSRSPTSTVQLPTSSAPVSIFETRPMNVRLQHKGNVSRDFILARVS